MRDGLVDPLQRMELRDPLQRSELAAFGRSPPVVQRAKRYTAEGLEAIKPGEEPTESAWYVADVEGDVNDKVYIHANDIEAFMGDFPEAMGSLRPVEDEQLPNVLEEEQEKLRDESSDGLETLDEDVWGESQSTQELEDKSRRLHFKNGKFKSTVDPKVTKEKDFSLGDLMGEPIKGKILQVIYRVPAGQRTHYEVMCVAVEVGEEGPRQVLVKIDFTMDGYRVIYDADDRSDGLETRDSADVSDLSITISDAMGMFAGRGYANGKYQEGSNTCHTFAFDFFTDLTGRKPKDD